MSVRPRLLARTAALVLAASAVPVATAASAHDLGDVHTAHGSSATHSRAASRGTVAEVRAAIAPYRDVDAALAAGTSRSAGARSRPRAPWASTT